MSTPLTPARPVRPHRQHAVALAYAAGSQAPTVVAKGHGLVAEQIIERAKDAGVFVHESKELVSLLMDIDLDGQIPPALYRAIAELLAWLYHIESAQQSGQPLPAPPDSALLIDSVADSVADSAANSVASSPATSVTTSVTTSPATAAEQDASNS